MCHSFLLVVFLSFSCPSSLSLSEHRFRVFTIVILVLTHLRDSCKKCHPARPLLIKSITCTLSACTPCTFTNTRLFLSNRIQLLEFSPTAVAPRVEAMRKRVCKKATIISSANKKRKRREEKRRERKKEKRRREEKRRRR